MKQFLAVVNETIVLLRRDYVFLPLFGAAILLLFFAEAASMWSILERRKMMLDIICGVLHVSGAFAAIFWGTKLFADSKTEGSLEILAATSIPRYLIVFGRFFGMVIVLSIFNFTMIIGYQLIVFSYDGEGWIPFREFITLVFYLESWICLAAIATMFSALGSQTTALFSTLVLWLLGLTSKLLTYALTEQSSPLMRLLATKVAQIWDFQKFNLADYIGLEVFPSGDQLTTIFLYGVLIITIALTIAILSFNQKDLAT